MCLVQELRNQPEIKVLLELMRLSDTETYNHSISVAELAEAILQQTEYTIEEKKDIITGALLHDIGKIFIPLHLTQLPQSLTAQEFNIIKIHTSVSYEIVKPVFSRVVQNICLYHHERPNGSGYTKNITLCDIPPEVLLIQVADIYDALTSKRSYKKSYSSEAALKILKEEATNLMLDDQYVKLLENVLIKKEM